MQGLFILIAYIFHMLFIFKVAALAFKYLSDS